MKPGKSSKKLGNSRLSMNKHYRRKLISLDGERTFSKQTERGLEDLPEIAADHKEERIKR